MHLFCLETAKCHMCVCHIPPLTHCLLPPPPPCASPDGRRTAQLLLLHLREQVPERGVPRDARRDHQQPVTKIQGRERQASALPPEMIVTRKTDTMP